MAETTSGQNGDEIQTHIGKFPADKMGPLAIKVLLGFYGGNTLPRATNRLTAAETIRAAIRTSEDAMNYTLEAHSTASIWTRPAFRPEGSAVLVGANARQLDELRSRIGGQEGVYLRYAELKTVEGKPKLAWSPATLISAAQGAFSRPEYPCYGSGEQKVISFEASMREGEPLVDSAVMGCLDGEGTFIPAHTYVLDIASPDEFKKEYQSRQVPFLELPGIAA